MNILLKQVSPFYQEIEGDNIRNSHGLNHVKEVMHLALKMNAKLNLGISEELIITASLLHDVFSDSINRDKHHELGAEFVRKRKIPYLQKFNDEEIELIALAINEHRGSYKGEFSSLLSELISSADRGEPNLDKLIKRSLKFNGGNMKDVIHHMKDKFGKGGYAKYPRIYRDYFKSELTELQNKIEAL